MTWTLIPGQARPAWRHDRHVRPHHRARGMALQAETNDLSVTEFGATLGALGLAQHRIAKLFSVGPRSVRRWQHGDRRVPRGVAIVCRLMATGTVTVAEVERAAASTPTRTNGRTKPKPSAPLLVTPAPAALARVEAATLVNPNLAVAEKVCALALKDARKSPDHAQPLGEDEGPWTREELEAMDSAFVAKLEAAFESGLEKRSSAANTVKLPRTSAPRFSTPLTKEICDGLWRSSA